MRIMIVDPGFSYSTLAVAESYYRAFVKLNYQTIEYDTLKMMQIYSDACIKDKKQFNLSEMSRFVFSPIVADVLTYKIDAILMIHGYYLHGEIINAIRQVGCKIGLILTDDPMQIDMSTEYSKFYDYIFTNEKYCLSRHGPRARYVPVAVDDSIFYPFEVDDKYKSDILISGSLYTERKQFIENNDKLVEVLKKYNTKIVGARKIEFEDPELNAMFGPAKISYEEMAKWTNGAKVTVDIPRNEFLAGPFGQTNRDMIKATYLNPRIYECTATKSHVVTSNDREEIDKLFPKGSIDRYKDADSLANLLESILDDIEMKKDCDDSNYDYCLKNHTYIHRAKCIAETMDLSPSVKEIARTNIVNDQIVERLEKDWEKNFELSKPFYTEDRSIERLKCKAIKYEQIDIISNGPSYEDIKYTEFCKQSAKMAVNEAIKFSLIYDYCVILHPTIDLYERCFKGLVVNPWTYLISSTLANERIILEWIAKCGQVYFYNPGPGLEIKDKVNELTKYPNFGAGFSVAYSAVAIAIYLGYKKINLYGFDFAYFKNRKYAYRDLDFDIIDKERTFLTKDGMGRPTLTDSNFIIARNCVLRLIEQNPNIEFNVHGGGMLYSERLKNLKVL